VTQLPNTPDKLRQLIEQAQAKLERLESRPVPREAIRAYRGLCNSTDSGEAIERGLRAAYPILQAAWESDGWIDWAGGECPVDDHQVVEVKFRDGCMFRCRAGDYAWFHDGSETRQGNGDIVAYRVEEEDS